MGQIGISSGFAQQSSFGPGNWELIIPWPEGGFAGFYRDDKGWHGPLVLTPPGSPMVTSLGFFEGDYHSDEDEDHHNFELIAVENGTLVHWWRENVAPYTWHRGDQLPGTTTAIGVAFGHSHLGVPDHSSHPVHEALMVSAPLAGGGISYTELPRQSGTVPPPRVWTAFPPPEEPETHFVGLGWALGAIGSQDPRWNESAEMYAAFVSPIRVAVRSDGAFLTYEWFSDGIGGQLNENPGHIGTGVRGRPAVLESDRNFNYSWPGSAQWRHGNYEAFAPAIGGGITHFWRVNDETHETWNLGATVGRLVYDEVSAFQSGEEEIVPNDSTPPVQLFAWNRGDRWVHHFTQRDLDNGFEWSGPFKIGHKPPAAGLLPGSPVSLGYGVQDAVALVVAADGSVQTTYRTESGWAALDTVSPAGTALPGTPVGLQHQSVYSAGQSAAVMSGADGSIQLMVMSNSGTWAEARPLAPAGSTVPGARVAVAMRGIWPGNTDVVWAGSDGSIQFMSAGKDDAFQWHGPAPIAPPGTVSPGAAITLFPQASAQLDLFYVPADGSVQLRWIEYEGDGSWQGPATIAPPGSAVPGSKVAVSVQGDRDQIDAMFVAPNGSLQLIWVSARENWQGPAEIAPPGSVTQETRVSMTERGVIDQINALYVAADGSIQVAWTTNAEPWRPPGPVTPPGTAIPGSEVGLLTQDERITALYVAPDRSIRQWAINMGGWEGPTLVAEPFPVATYESANALVRKANDAWGKPDRELAAIRSFEAAAAAREIAAANPAYLPTLGEWLLHPIQTYVAESGRSTEAIAATGEALTLFERLGAEHPEELRYRYQQARALVTLATRLAGVDDLSGAAAKALEAAAVVRQVAVEDPAYRDAFGQWLIWPIQVYVSNGGDHAAALELGTEALGIFEQLTQADPANRTHTYNHARALVQLALRLWDVNQRDHAADRALQAAGVAKRLTDAVPAHLPSRGSWLLWPIIPFLRSTDRRTDALQAAREAVEIFEKLAADKPAEYAEKLAAARKFLTELS